MTSYSKMPPKELNNDFNTAADAGMMERILLPALEEILGAQAARTVLQHSCLEPSPGLVPDTLENRAAGPNKNISAIQAALEQLYGPRSGRGLALRSGRVAFKMGLRQFGAALGLTDLSFRLLPFDVKLRAGANLFSDTFNKVSDQRLRVEEQPDRFLWHIESCPVCRQRQTQEPVCHLAVGVLQEALNWVSGGKYFPVEEILCIARGDPTCTIAISKTPLL